MPKIKVNDINLYYESYGQGQPIIFITGIGADRTIWQGIISAYASDYQVIIVDNRGCGFSDSPDVPYSIEMMADDIAALCEVLGISACHFVGSSMGGAIAQMLAFKHAKLCRTVVIVNSFTKADVRFALFAKGMCKLLEQNIASPTLTELSLGWAFSDAYLNKSGVLETIMAAAATNPFPTTAIGYKNQLHAIMEFNSASWLPKINVPCLVTGSDRDMIFSQEHMYNLAKLIPGALYHFFPGVGHLPFIEEPEAFNKLVKSFIKYHE